MLLKKSEQKIQDFEPLQHSYMVRYGMVYSTQPISRAPTSIVKLFGQTVVTTRNLTVSDIQHCLINRCIPVYKEKGASGDQECQAFSLLQQNIAACMNPKASLSFLKLYISSQKRLDNEQVVALIMSMVGPEAAASLVPQFEDLLRNTCMWMEPVKDEPQYLTDEEQALVRKYKKIKWHLDNRNTVMPDFKDYDDSTPLQNLLENTNSFLHQLSKVRRKRKKLNNAQTLYLPERFAQNHRFVVPNPHKHTYRYATKRPEAGGAEEEEQEDEQAIIILSKRQFKRVNKYLGRMNGSNQIDQIYGRQIKAFLDAFYQADQLPLLETNDRLSFAFSFLNYQRRLQPKIVSNLGAPSSKPFQGKNEGKKLQQNTPDRLTSLENALAQLALARAPAEIDLKALSCVTVPPHYVIEDNHVRDLTYYRVDWACLLMERYVTLYGDGKFEKLSFEKGQVGGSGRGPIDRYNLLVDVLRDIKMQGRNKGVVVEIGQCHKFLAKDIMHFNRAWGDDAFASGKVPGWYYYLRDRRERGTLNRIEGLNDGKSQQMASLGRKRSQKGHQVERQTIQEVKIVSSQEKVSSRDQKVAGSKGLIDSMENNFQQINLY